MKVVENTSTRLKLLHYPVYAWLAGAIFVASGLFITAEVGKLTVFNCNRVEPSQGLCTLKASSLLKTESQEIQLATLQGAIVDEIHSSKGTTFRLVIVTTNGEIPFTSYYNPNQIGKQINATRITDFISQPTATSLTIRQDDRGSTVLFGGVFVAGGMVVVLLMGEIVACQFDKTMGRFTLQRRGLLGTKVIEHSIREIKDVIVEESTSSDGSTYRVSLILIGRDRIPLTSYYSSGRAGKQKIADSLHQFLHLKS